MERATRPFGAATRRPRNHRLASNQAQPDGDGTGDVVRPAGRRTTQAGGPNNAGKIPFAREFLPEDAGILHFVNADLIASGLSPLRPELAAFASGCPSLAGLHRLDHVRQGAHTVPGADILRRFVRGWINFGRSYRTLAHAWALHENSAAAPSLIESGP